MEKNERVEAKRTELMKSFETLPPEQLKVAQDLISQAAFMAVELEDLAEVIAAEGMTEIYTNGKNQSGRKISSNAKMYSALIGKYNSIVSRLIKLVPVKDERVQMPSPFEIAQAKKDADEKEFREAQNFVDSVMENATPEVAAEINRIWKEDVFFDYVATAKLIRERGLLNGSET